MDCGAPGAGGTKLKGVHGSRAAWAVCSILELGCFPGLSGRAAWGVAVWVSATS